MVIHTGKLSLRFEFHSENVFFVVLSNGNQPPTTDSGDSHNLWPTCQFNLLLRSEFLRYVLNHQWHKRRLSIRRNDVQNYTFFFWFINYCTSNHYKQTLKHYPKFNFPVSHILAPVSKIRLQSFMVGHQLVSQSRYKKTGSHRHDQQQNKVQGRLRDGATAVKHSETKTKTNLIEKLN